MWITTPYNKRRLACCILYVRGAKKSCVLAWWISGEFVYEVGRERPVVGRSRVLGGFLDLLASGSPPEVDELLFLLALECQEFLGTVRAEDGVDVAYHVPEPFRGMVLGFVEVHQLGDGQLGLGWARYLFHFSPPAVRAGDNNL